MNYLIDKNSVIGGVDYSTGGRPLQCTPTSANKISLNSLRNTREFLCHLLISEGGACAMEAFYTQFIQETLMKPVKSPTGPTPMPTTTITATMS